MDSVKYQVISGQNLLGEFFNKDYAVIFVKSLINEVDANIQNYSISINKITTKIEDKKPVKEEKAKK